MEYEIEGERTLFDESTNPSLKRAPLTPGRVRGPAERRKLQKAEPIPDEEEPQAA
jgi:hypothetical protein